MSWQSIVEGLLLIVALVVTVPSIGRYLAAVYGTHPATEDESPTKAPGDRFFSPIERFVYRICGIDERSEQRWNVYALALLAFSLVSVLVLYALQRLQGSLPFTRPTGRRCHRGVRSTSPSASSPTPTGSGTRAKWR